MGNTCKSDQNHHQQTQVTMISMQPPSDNKIFKKNSNTASIRFGEVQKIRSSSILQNNKYCFMLPIRNSDQVIKVELPVVTSYADQLNIKSKILQGEQIQNKAVVSQIIDTLDYDNDLQIYHNYMVMEESEIAMNDIINGGGGQNMNYSEYSVKIYPFKNYHDPVFKSALNQAALYKYINSYQNLPNPSLKQILLLERGTPSSIVFIHQLHLCTLFDILQYRKSANLPYTKNQQNYIASQILQKYKVLKVNNIAHRDIRPSKVYLADPGYSIDRNGNRILNERRVYSDKFGYQFLNLQSSRRYNSREKSHEELMQSVRGVGIYCSQQIKDHIVQKQSTMASYNAFANDRIQLAKLFICIITLQPFYSQQGQADFQNGIQRAKKINEQLAKVCDKLYKYSEYEEPVQTLANQISIKNIPVQTILQSDHKIAINLLPNLIKKAHKQRIQNSRLEAMFALHQRDQLTKTLSQKIQNNYQNHQYYQNIDILDRVGRYYEGVGIPNNDYYNEEVTLLLDMIEQERIKGFAYDDMLGKANDIHNQKLMKNNRKISLTGIRLAMENAYHHLSMGNEDDAKRDINYAFRSAGEVDIVPVPIQLKLLQAKGQIQSKCGDEIIAQDMLQKGLQLCSNRRAFTTQFQRLDIKSTFEYLLGKNTLKMLIRDKQQMGGMQNRSIINTRAKNLGKCDILLQSAKNTKVQLPRGNPVKLGKVYEALGDLASFKENYQQSVQYYERTFRLYHNSDDYYVSNSLKIDILQKMYKVHINHLEDAREQQMIKSQINEFKKKEQKYKKDPRTNFSKLKSLARKNRMRSDRKDYQGSQSVIEEEEEGDDQQNRMSLHKKNSIDKSMEGTEIRGSGNNGIRESSNRPGDSYRGGINDSYGGFNQGRGGMKDSSPGMRRFEQQDNQLGYQNSNNYRDPYGDDDYD